MTNSKNTKRALLASVLSVVACVAMLVGGTFAWFTDSVTSAGNIIKSGNLDVALEWANGTTDPTANATGQWKDASEGAIFNYELWEPGYTEARHVRISNNGSLALKYEIRIVANGTVSELAKVIDVYYIKDGKQLADRSALEALEPIGTLAEVLAKPYAAKGHILAGENVADVATIALKMQESAGNEYKDKSIGTDFSVQLVATQYMYESDSFGSNYDEKAVYPDVAYAQPSTQDELNSILNNPIDSNGEATRKVVVKLSGGNYTLPAITGNKKVAIFGGDSTVIDMTNSGIIGAQNAGLDLTIEGAQVNFANVDYKGITHSEKVTYKDCTITGKQFLYAEEVEFINCKFVQDAVDYNVWTYGAGKVLFKNCDFSCQGKSVLIYNEGGATGEQTVEFQNCKFNALAPADGKAAIEIDSYGSSYNVIIDKATADNVSGFANGSVSQNPVWNVKRNNKPVTVTVAGIVVYNQ